MKKNFLDKKSMEELKLFIDKYGNDALISALQHYDTAHQLYTCKTKLFTKQIPIYSINYIEIFKHEIVIHTTMGNYSKYGTLKKEYDTVKKWGFVKCSQSFLVPLDKIAEIRGKNVILTTGDSFSLSRSCATEVIYAYVKKNMG